MAKKVSELPPIVDPLEDTDIINVVRSGVSYQADMSQLNAKFESLLTPSGDAATDTLNIQGAIDSQGVAALGPGSFYTNAPIVIDNDSQGIIGQGIATVIRPELAGSHALVRITGQAKYTTLSDLMLFEGLYGVDMENATRMVFHNLRVHSSTSHGIYIHGGNQSNDSITLVGCRIQQGGGDGIHSLSTTGETNGNALTLLGCMLEQNAGHGISWCANTLCISGGVVQGNTDSGVHLFGNTGNASDGMMISGVHFEENGVANIELEGGTRVANVKITGNLLTNTGKPNILASGTTSQIRYVVIDRSNRYLPDVTQDHVDVDGIIWSDVDIPTRNWLVLNNENDNKLDVNATRNVKTEKFTLDASAGSAGKNTALITIPGGSIVHEVITQTLTAFNGSTPSASVGTVADPNLYIAAADFDTTTVGSQAYMVGGANNTINSTDKTKADVDLIIQWTNNGGTAGSIDIYVTTTGRIWSTNSRS